MCVYEQKRGDDGKHYYSNSTHKQKHLVVVVFCVVFRIDAKKKSYTYHILQLNEET